MIIHFNVTHNVVEYMYAIKAEEGAKAQLIQLYIDFPSSRFFKITFGVINAVLTFYWPTLKQLRVTEWLC